MLSAGRLHQTESAMTSDELQQLLEPGVLEELRVHEHVDPAEFAMKHHGRAGFPVRAIAEQIACRKKARKKLPELSRRSLLYTTLSLEQASGERSARYKSDLEGMQGKTMLDMTGGLGIDALFFSRRFDKVIYVEQDPVLARIAGHNFNELGAGTIQVITGDSIAYLMACPDKSFDWIYVDPARRAAGKRLVNLQECEPDVVGLHDLFLRKSHNICIKASPAHEITVFRDMVPSLREVLVLSVDGECREILLFCRRHADVSVHQVTVRAVCLTENGASVISSCQENVTGKPMAENVGAYLYEPDPAIIKACLVPVLARIHGMHFFNSHVELLTSDKRVASFPGRRFRVCDTLPYKPRYFSRYLKNNGIGAASVHRRNFPLSPDEIRRRYRLKESRRRFLFFTRNRDAALICIVCERERVSGDPG